MKCNVKGCNEDHPEVVSFEIDHRESRDMAETPGVIQQHTENKSVIHKIHPYLCRAIEEALKRAVIFQNRAEKKLGSKHAAKMLSLLSMEQVQAVVLGGLDFTICTSPEEVFAETGLRDFPDIENGVAVLVIEKGQPVTPTKLDEKLN